MKDINLKMLTPWNGYREPTFLCPICKSSIKYLQSHYKFDCDWLGAKVQFTAFSETIVGEVSSVDNLYENIEIIIDHNGVDVAFRAMPKEFKDLVVLEMPLSEYAKMRGWKRGHPNQHTYRET